MAAFTTVAAGIGLATTAATTGMSFAQAGKQRKAMKKAEAAADSAMQEARKKLEVNQFDKLGINKEPYELAREELASTAQAALQQAAEGETRGLGATAGRVQMAQNEGQEAIRSQMGQDLQQLEMLSAQEDARLQDIGVQLDLEEVAGAQLAAANAQELGAQAMAQGFEGLTSMGSQLAEQAPLFEKTASSRQIKRMERAGKRQDLDAAGVQAKVASIGKVGDVDYGQVAGMQRADYLDFMRGQDSQNLFDISAQLGLNRKQNLKQLGAKVGAAGKQVGGKVAAALGPGIQQGRAEMQKAGQLMQSSLDRAKQGRANMFLKDLIDYDFLNPFRR